MTSFKSLLFDTSALIKTAGPDSQSKVQLEQDFGRLAYTFFKDRAPQLLSFLLGFEIVDQEEDGSKAVGIFGCKIGDGYYYIPVFFINNQIKGMDLLYNKASNVFVPLQESWINYILDKQTVKLGSTVGNTIDLRKDFETPNFRFLQYPYQYYKTAEARQLMEDAVNVWNDMQVKIAEMFSNDEQFKLAMAGAVMKAGDKYSTFEKQATGDLITFLKTKGNANLVETLINTMDDARFAKAAMAFYSTDALAIAEFDTVNKVAEEKIKVITEATPSLVEPDKKKLIRDGFIIKDIREPKEKSELFATDYVKRFTAPADPGLYDVLLTSGGTVSSWVLGPAKPLGNRFIVIEPDSMFCVAIPTKRLIVRDERKDHTDDNSIYKKAIGLDKVQPGETYVLINDKLNSSDMFRVCTVRDANDTRTEYDVYFESCYSEPKELGTWDSLRDRNDEPDYVNVNKIQLANYPGDKLRIAGDKLIVPNSWKALKVVYRPYGDDEAAYKAFKPGTLIDLDEALFKNAINKLTVESADKGLEYLIRFNDFTDGPYNRKTAMLRLVKNYGLSVEDTEATLKEAADSIKSRKLLKLAQSSGVGVAMPPPIPQYFSSDPYNGAITQGPDEQLVSGRFTGVPALQDPMRYGFNLGGDTQTNIDRGGTGGSPTDLQNEVIELTQRAAETGQKSVFDYSTISGLTQLYDLSSVVDGYLPEMLKALDRVGRVLFIFYWKNSDFVERYGDEGINDFEDSLRNVFKSFGDLILRLKQKAISSNVDSLV